MNTSKFSKRWIFIVPILLAIFLLRAPNQSALARFRGEYRPSQILVQLDPLSGATIDDLNADYSTTTLQTFSLSTNIYLLQIPTGEDAKDFAELLNADLRTFFAEPDFIGQTPEAHRRGIWGWGGQDPTPLGEQYALEALNIPAAHTLSQGAGTVVAVLDTGVQLDHPNLVGVLTTTGYDFVDNDPLPNDEFNGLDDEIVPGSAGGHGTHVAGIVHLTAPAAQIMPLRILDPDGRGDVSTLIEAIKYAVDHGADVINLSLGTPDKSDALKTVIRYATQNGVVVVAAAGNLETSQKEYPAATQCALAVTSVGLGGIKTDFANYGKWISFAAPGEGIYSTFPISGYAWWSGTSMAVPFVAGQAALIASLAPTLNPRQIALLIGGTAVSLDAVNPEFAGELGLGQPDIEASLLVLLSGNLPTSNRGLMSSSCVTTP